MNDPVVGGSVLVLAGLLVILMIRHAEVAFAVAIASFLIPLTLWNPGFDTRPVALFAAAMQLPGLRNRVRGRQLKDHLNPWVLGAGVAITLAGTASIGWSLAPSTTVTSVAAWAATLVIAIVFTSVLSRDQIARVVGFVLVAVVAISALMFIVRFPGATAGGRARGMLSNANGLGIFCAMSLPTLLTYRKSLRWLGCAGALALLVATNSRAGTLAAVVGLGVFAFRSAAGWVRFVIATATVCVLPFVSDLLDVMGSDAPTTGLLRTNDSRSQLWALTLDTFQAHPVTGIGLGALDIVGGNSYLKMLAELGFLGAALGIVLVAAYVSAVKASTTVTAFLFTGLTSAVFESWLFAAGSLFCFLTFIMCVQDAVDEKTRDGHHLDRERPHSAVRRSSQPVGSGRRPGDPGALPRRH